MTSPAKTARTAGRGRAKSPADLARIELRGTRDVAAYAQEARDLGRALAMELDMTAHELDMRLAKAGAGLWERFAARRASRQVTNRLRRSAAHANAAGDECMRFWRAYRQVYAELIDPDRRKSSWDFKDK